MRLTSSKTTAEMLWVLASVLLAGCSSLSTSSSSVSPGLPAPPSTAAVNQYVGTEASQSGEVDVSAGLEPQGGLYTVTVDDSKQTYSYFDAGVYSPGTGGGNNYLQVPFVGTFTPSGGFLSMLSNSYQHLSTPALAIEIPGRALLMRPGTSDSVPVVAVAQNSCATINGGANFLFVAMPGLFAFSGAQPGYGSMQIATSGADWNFSKFTEFTLDGASISTVPLQKGECSQTLAGQAVSIPADLKNNILPITVAVGPSGFFILDQNSGSVGVLPTVNGGPSLVGVIEPAAALDTGALAGAKYLGFFYETATASGVVSQPVAFGPTTPAGGSLLGGAFPGNDPTQTPSADTTVTLGSQASSANGTFAAATVTRPDPFTRCAIQQIGTPGVDANGNPICTFPAVAVAGNPESKFAIFLYAQDYTTASPMGLYLYQQ